MINYVSWSAAKKFLCGRCKRLYESTMQKPQCPYCGSIDPKKLKEKSNDK
jgi:rRNA maturation endonuclease Nob1